MGPMKATALLVAGRGNQLTKTKAIRITTILLAAWQAARAGRVGRAAAYFHEIATYYRIQKAEKEIPNWQSFLIYIFASIYSSLCLSLCVRPLWIVSSPILHLDTERIYRHKHIQIHIGSGQEGKRYHS